MKPYFKVGEEVLLRSVDHPHLNNDNTTVLTFVPDNTVYSCPHCGKRWHFEVGGYFIDVFADDCCSPWKQSALRKKYPPASQSFNDMMESLKEKHYVNP